MVEQGTKRIAEINRLIEKVFEQNARDKLFDESFSKMLQSYEKEQKALTQKLPTTESNGFKAFALHLREMTEIN